MKYNWKNDDDSFDHYLETIETGKLWEAYYFLKESLSKLPKISSYTLMYVIFQTFKDSERPIFEYKKHAISLMGKLRDEIIKRNTN
jgi:hypothetical protein